MGSELLATAARQGHMPMVWRLVSAVGMQVDVEAAKEAARAWWAHVLDKVENG